MSGYDEHRSAYVFAGVVYGWLSCLAFVLLCGGCWTGTVAPVVETRIVRAPPKLTCDKLTTISGNVPPEADLAKCIEGDYDFYWMCSDGAHTDEIFALRQWIETAKAVCTP